MKRVSQINSEGYFIEDVILNDDDFLPENCIVTICPNGLYKPKWGGTGWVEGLTQEEIDAIKNTPLPTNPLEVLQEKLDLANTELLSLRDTINYILVNY